MRTHPPSRPALRVILAFVFPCIVLSPLARGQHVTMGPWYITADYIWNQYPFYDAHGDGGGRAYVMYREYAILSGNVSSIRLLHAPTSDVSVLKIANLSEPFFRVVDQGPQSAWIARLDTKNGRTSARLHCFDVQGNERYRPGGLVLSGSMPVISLVLRRAAEGAVHACWWGEDAMAVQTVDASGAPQWGSNGLSVAMRGPAGSFIDDMTIAAAADGGVAAAWTQHAPGNGERLLCAQRVRRDGTIAWAAEGIVVDRSPGDLTIRSICPDASGGVFLHWSRGSALLLQHLDGSGAPMLDAGGIAVGSLPDTIVRVKPDGRGGILMHSGTSVRRIGPDNAELWGGQPVIFAVEPTPGTFAEVSADGRGGAFVVWNGAPYLLQAQWIDSTGRRQWGGGMILLANPSYEMTGVQSPPFASPTALFTADATSGFVGNKYFFTFVDTLLLAPTAVLAPAAAPSAIDITVSPSPAAGLATVHVALVRPSPVRVDMYDALGRHEGTLFDVAMEAGSHRVPVDLGAFPPGVHVLVVRANAAIASRRITLLR